MPTETSAPKVYLNKALDVSEPFTKNRTFKNADITQNTVI